jgi:hypothetical protein
MSHLRRFLCGEPDGGDMVPTSKTFLIRGGIAVLLVLALGWSVKSRFTSRPQPKVMPQAGSVGTAGAFSDPSAIANLYATAAMADDPKVMEVMARYRLGPKAANYITQGKLQIVSQTDTSLHFVLTFADQTTIDETAKIAADPSYTPTAADLEQGARRRSPVHAVKLTHQKTGENKWQYTLQYHVPYSSLPPDLLQKLHSPAQHASTFFSIVTPAYAQDGLLTGEAVWSVIANVAAAHYEEISMGKSLGADVPLAVFDLIMDGIAYKGWMSEMSEMEDCAKNPTNPISQKASQDPNYQHEVMDQVGDATGDVASTAVPMLASDAAGYLSHFLPFGGGAVTALLFSTQDDAVNEYAENRIKEAQKYIVPCDKENEMTAFGFRPMSGKFEYKYNASSKECTHQGSEQGCNFKTEVRESTGTFEIDPNATEASDEASNVGSGYRNSDGGFENPVCHGETHDHAKGPIKVHVEVGGIPESALLRLSAEGDWDAKLDSTNNCGAMPNVHHAYKTDGGAGCEFKGVNMVTGGHYSTFVAADQGHGTCTVELERK